MTLFLWHSKKNGTHSSESVTLQKRTKPADPAQVDRDMEILEVFARVYCRHHHGEMVEGVVCQECRELLEYARGRREACPYDPKPKCKECPTHCYRPKYREKVRVIMRYSGMYFIKRGRLDWLVKYFLRGG